MIRDKKDGQIYRNIWFGHFYRPAYDDEEFVRRCCVLLRELGFNSVLLDTKDWQDFRDRFAGGPASQYVRMHEFMQKSLAESGLTHAFLALYLNGDNLYPAIRFSPPVYGESVVGPDGKDGKWYRYWSVKARETMVEHVAQLMENYGSNHTVIEVNGQERKPLCSMWDPIVAPSFDREGKARYLSWLEKKYANDVEALNRAYGLCAGSFMELEPEEYWYACRYPGQAPTEEMLRKKESGARIWADNQCWRREELEDYFADMQSRLHALDPSLYLVPDMAQWGYFLNIHGSALTGADMSDLWDTAVRGIDLYRLAPYVDCVHFISVPVTPYGDPDAYVTACHHTMMRNMNRGREFVGGIYWGRFLYNDLYAWITPCEILASMVGAGIGGYASYGMCGLDDGGVLHRMDPAFNESLRLANAWMEQVMPLLGEKERARVAILFPSAMALIETMDTPGNKERRMDLLGWYKLVCDLGLETDIVDGTMLEKPGLLEQYQVLILPQDDCYGLDPNPALQKRLVGWVEGGGVLLHGPGQALAEEAFGIYAKKHPTDAFYYREAGMVGGDRMYSWEQGEAICTWLSDKSMAVALQRRGRGKVYSFGFDYGYAYTARMAPHVPREQKNNEMYPIPMLLQDPVKDILEEALQEKLTWHKGVEILSFTNGKLIVNHTSYPYALQENGKKYFQLEQGGSRNWLPPHSGVFIELSYPG